jgi:hypothetical protein
MPDMQNIETAVRKYQAFRRFSQPDTPFDDLFQGQDFI